jgi:hypothetical protein
MISLWMILAAAPVALAEVDPNCDELVAPPDYDEQTQQDFLANYPALATSLSPIHAPIPHKPGGGAIGLDLLFIPPLGCGQRMVLDFTKTEDTNRAPVAPRPRVTFAMRPIFGRVFPYGGAALVPPVPINGTRSLIVSGELGLGLYVAKRGQVALRGHSTLQRTLGDVATAFEPDEPTLLDLYVASSMGLDLMAGIELGQVTPYASVGVLDVSTFFWIGDDSVVTNNLHPYLGPAISLGVDSLLREKIRVGGELYVAPGGHSSPDETAPSLTPTSRYGHLTTVRLRAAWEL